jgi:hypothetical protein
MKAPDEKKKKEKRKKRKRKKKKREQAEAYFLRPWREALHSPSGPDNSFAKIEKLSCPTAKRKAENGSKRFQPRNLFGS